MTPNQKKTPRELLPRSPRYPSSRNAQSASVGPNRRLARNPFLRALAQNTSMKMTGEFIPEGTFPWDKLPRELRLQILNYTHLSESGSYDANFKALHIEYSHLIRLQPGTSIRIHCCENCTHTFADCCCANIHSSYSTTCECRTIPFALFYVSKQMYADAFEILYSKNFFDFTGNLSHVIEFFQTRPPKALGLMRALKVQFTEDDLYDWHGSEMSQKWQALVDYIKANLYLPKLSITIDLTAEEEFFTFDYQDSEPKGVSEEEEMEMMFVYEIHWDIANRLSVLEGLEEVRFELGVVEGFEAAFREKGHG